MIDDRPIKPDKKYLEEYIQKISVVEPKTYLKKKQQPILPCYAHQQYITEHKQKVDRRSKAEIYEEIKRKNRERFGEKEVKVVEIKQEKKIDPKKITVGYKPKSKEVRIEIDQYKKKGFTKSHKDQSKKDTAAKIEYERLLEFYRKEIKQFEEEKNKFEEMAGKLKFKDTISKQQGLEFSKVKSQVERNLITQHLSMKSGDAVLQNCRSQHNGQRLRSAGKSRKQTKKQPPLSKTFSIGEIRECMNITSEKLSKLKHQLLKDEIEVNQHRYDISQIYLLPEFTPQTLYDYLDASKLKFNQNQMYKTALKVFNSKFTKENQEDNIQKIDQVEERGVKQDIKVKYVGDKRIMKYEGWTEVWIPGKQRLMTNKQGYKVVWLGNGDVLQEFGNKVTIYYSKSKKILEINYHNNPPIYYHQGLNQIWRVLEDDSKQVVFGNGRREIVVEKQEFR